jgi:hypothetical protein
MNKNASAPRFDIIFFINNLITIFLLAKAFLV